MSSSPDQGPYETDPVTLLARSHRCFLRSLEAQPLLKGLKNREREVLGGLALGLSHKEIATKLGISVRTVEIHRATLDFKIGTRKSIQVARIGVILGADFEFGETYGIDANLPLPVGASAG